MSEHDREPTVEPGRPDGEEAPPTVERAQGERAEGERAEGEMIVEVRVVARPERLKLVRSVVTEAARASGCSERCVRDMVIAVDEACQNVIRHAYGGETGGEIVLEIRREGDRMAFNLVDFAAPIDTSQVKPRDLDDIRPGGLGTHFIRECMDEADFRTPPAGAGNRLWMVKRIE